MTGRIRSPRLGGGGPLVRSGADHGPQLFCSYVLLGRCAVFEKTITTEVMERRGEPSEQDVAGAKVVCGRSRDR